MQLKVFPTHLHKTPDPSLVNEVSEVAKSILPGVALFCAAHRLPGAGTNIKQSCG